MKNQSTDDTAQPALQRDRRELLTDVVDDRLATGQQWRFTIANGRITEIEVIGNPVRLAERDVSIVE